MASHDAFSACMVGIILLVLAITTSKNEKMTAHPVAAFIRRIKAWMFLVRGPSIIQDAYDKAQGNPFIVEVPENRYHFISSRKHINEVDTAPDAILSLQGAAKQIIQPKYTLHKFNWSDQRGKDGTPLVRTLRVLLTNALPDIMPEARRAMTVMIDRAYDAAPTKNGLKAPPLFPIIIESIAYCNAMAFFGKEIAQNESFIRASVGFIENTLISSEIVRVLPSAISQAVGTFLASRFTSQHTMFDALLPIAEQRLEERARQKMGQQVPLHRDCIQWVIENSPRTNPWAAARVVHELLALWFGSVHITSTTTCFAIHDLCLRQEYVPVLREELQSTGWDEFDRTGGQGLPLLDSFIKESARTSPVEALSTRRMALQPFQLSDGHRVDPGEWVCTPPKAMSRDPRNYTQPLEFHGFRFVSPEVFDERLGTASFRAPEAGQKSQLTSIEDLQLWGTGRCACPGRFYAGAIMKTMLGLFITRWDMQLEHPAKSRYFTWRSFIYPWRSTAVLLQPHEAAD